jgi:hypothetical protein
MKLPCLILGCLVLASTPVAAGSDPIESKSAPAGFAYGKPRAPLTIEWVAFEGDSLVAVIHPRADYERIEVVLIEAAVTGVRAKRIFPAGLANEPLEVEFPSASEAARLMVLMETGGRVMKRASAPPGAAAALERYHRERRHGRVDEPAGLRVLPATRSPD